MWVLSLSSPNCYKLFHLSFSSIFPLQEYFSFLETICSWKFLEIVVWETCKWKITMGNHQHVQSWRELCAIVEEPVKVTPYIKTCGTRKIDEVFFTVAILFWIWKIEIETKHHRTLSVDDNDILVPKRAFLKTSHLMADLWIIIKNYQVRPSSNKSWIEFCFCLWEVSGSQASYYAKSFISQKEEDERNFW